jgi:hypothetical protein
VSSGMLEHPLHQRALVIAPPRLIPLRPSRLVQQPAGASLRIPKATLEMVHRPPPA